MGVACRKASSLARPLAFDMADAALRIVAIMSRDTASLAALEKQSPLSPAVSDLVYRGLRHWGLAQVRLARMANQAPEIKISALLAIAWAAMHERMREPYVLLDQAVNAAKRLVGQKPAGFVNALLRNTVRDPQAVEDFENPVAKWNAPLWWIEKIQRDWGEQASDVLAALQVRAPLTVRLAGGLEAHIESYLEQLAAQGLSGRVLGPAAVSIEPAVSVDRIPGFAQGQACVQDASAQQAANLFDDLLARGQASQGRPTVLDACAAPGGKAIALAQRHAADVWALDSSSVRLGRLKADLPRVLPTLKGHIHPVNGDVLSPAHWPETMPRQFDAILLDAPCSASGVSRRHPEIAWKRTPEEIAAVADTQRKMLDVLWARLKPGGELAFVTCSVFREEGETQAQLFLERTSDARALPCAGRLLPMASPQTGHNQDGFFFAKFKKVSGTVGLAAVDHNCVHNTAPGIGQ